MNRVLILIVAVVWLVAGSAQAQNISIGGRIGDLKIKEWMGNKPSSEGARLITFFHSSSSSSIAQLATQQALAKQFGELTVIVLSKESTDKISRYFPADRAYFVAIDDNARTFTSLEVDFVPFSILVDSRGRVLWFGAVPTAKIVSENLK